MLLISYICRFILLINRNFRCWRFIILAMMIYFIINLYILLKQTRLNSKSIFGNKYLRQQLLQDKKKNENIQNIRKRSSSSLCICENNNKKTLQSHSPISPEARLRYSFIDIDDLDVDINYLNEEYRPSQQLNILPPSPDSHPYTRILNVKGDTSVIIYNRLPQCYEHTMGLFLQDISYLHSYTYISSQIYVPFSYNNSALVSIARSLNKHKFKQLIYERHIYFFDYYALQFPNHPVWINLVRDPMYRIAAEYKHSREICRTTNRCFVQQDAINETLDECVIKRSPKECISSDNGIARMLPFFCGLKYSIECQEENDWALKQAKQNIDFFYTVVGIAEEFYKFLYILEKLLPQYFKLARILFMNQHDPKILADKRDINVRLPNKNTTKILMPFLKYEYDLYNYIKKRFLDQYNMLLELDN
ncbi:unnamed protein product [Rotaria sordida]|uniref:Uncharacterized protein n=1 Tax=Rotaria sordida TaxID=392033 RepID=A0A819C2F1_9BILA|nr:unnamed protein product [Rotaria sordida]CAF3810793.1 unnamed protein product [Rotaria sordida]